MQNYAIENDLLKHPQRMLISSFKLENGAIITPLFNFYMELELQCTTVYRFLHYLTRKASTSLFSQLLMLEGKEMGIHYPVLWQRL